MDFGLLLIVAGVAAILSGFVFMLKSLSSAASESASSRNFGFGSWMVVIGFFFMLTAIVMQ